MKRGCMGLLLLVAMCVPLRGLAQVSVYATASASQLQSPANTDYPIGFTAGLLFDGPHLKRGFALSANLQERYVRSSIESLNGLTIGPRVYFPPVFKFSPYAEFMVGFARYHNDPAYLPTTDGTIQINGGVARKLTPHFDAVAEFSYAQYYALGGVFNPKTYSLGAIYHLNKR